MELKWSKNKEVSLPCRKQICVWASFCRAVMSIWTTLSVFRSATEGLLSSTTTTGEKSARRRRSRSALSGMSHSKDTTELLDLRRSIEFQLTFRDSQMWAKEKSRKGRQSSTTHPPEVYRSRGVLSMWTNSSPVMSKGSPLEVIVKKVDLKYSQSNK